MVKEAQQNSDDTSTRNSSPQNQENLEKNTCLMENSIPPMSAQVNLMSELWSQADDLFAFEDTLQDYDTESFMQEH